MSNIDAGSKNGEGRSMEWNELPDWTLIHARRTLLMKAELEPNEKTQLGLIDDALEQRGLLTKGESLS